MSRVASATGLTDRRRLIAAALSALLPGLGQLANGRRTFGLRMLVPSLVVGLLVAVVWLTTPPMRLAATLIVPATLQLVLVLDVLILAWRLFAVLHAFFDRSFAVRPGRVGIVGLAVIVALVAVPHVLAGYYGWIAYGSFAKVFGDTTVDGAPIDRSAGPAWASGTRLNVLLTGVDTGPGRHHALTDTMIVASLDPVGKTVTLISIPRDMVNVPLGNGDVYGPKLNSLEEYAAAHPKDFPHGAARALPDAIGALLGLPIHYTAQIDLGGFVHLVDRVGGVDVTVAKPLSDPDYGGFGVGPGWSITAGEHHLDGADALAYARIRKSTGETDFTRAARQQQILVALRDAVVTDDLLFQVPALLGSLGDTVRTDLPADRLPDLAVLAQEVSATDATLVVVKWPLVHPGKNNPYGSVQIPDVTAIQAMVRLAAPAPGIAPTPWPTPKPTKAPASPKASPKASPTAQP